MLRDCSNGSYVGKKGRNLCFVSESGNLVVPDSVVRRDVILFDGKNGFNGKGHIGFEYILRERYRKVNLVEIMKYTDHVNQIAGKRIHYLPERILRGITNIIERVI